MSVQFNKIPPSFSTPNSPETPSKQHRSDLSAAFALLSNLNHHKADVSSTETAACPPSHTTSPSIVEAEIHPASDQLGTSPSFPPSGGDDYRHHSHHSHHAVHQHNNISVVKHRQSSRDKRLSSATFASLDAAGVITPALLAKYHLPGILINRGPLSVRHISACLNISVPGFSAIPVAKQRRLVVSAMEGPSQSRTGGSKVGDVIYEKIGWGKWAARIVGMHQTNPSSVDLSHPTRSTKSVMPKDSTPAQTIHSPELLIAANDLDSSVGSWSNESGIFLHDEYMDMHRPGGIRLPSFAVTSESEDPNQQCATPLYSDLDDMTDEEDWESMGVEELRRATSTSPATPGLFSTRSPAYGNLLTPAGQERDAIEALVQLSSF